MKYALVNNNGEKYVQDYEFVKLIDAVKKIYEAPFEIEKTVEADNIYDAASDLGLAKSVEGKLNIINVRPAEPPRFERIDEGLKGLQNAVGGFISSAYSPMDLSMIINDEGKIEGLSLNRAFMMNGEIYDITAGNMVFSDIDDEGRSICVTRDTAIKAETEFKCPEAFYFEGPTKRNFMKRDLDVITAAGLCLDLVGQDRVATGIWPDKDSLDTVTKVCSNLLEPLINENRENDGQR